MSSEAESRKDSGDSSGELSPTAFAFQVVLWVLPGLTALVMMLGKLAGWHWFQTYHVLDTGLFLIGALFFMAGAFSGIPQFQRKTPDQSEYPPPPQNSEEEETQRMEASEKIAQARTRRRAPGLMLAGVWVLLCTLVVFQLRNPLGRLYGFSSATRPSPIEGKPLSLPPPAPELPAGSTPTSPEK
jgi:signal transduction histidine kinase